MDFEERIVANLLSTIVFGVCLGVAGGALVAWLAGVGWLWPVAIGASVGSVAAGVISIIRD